MKRYCQTLELMDDPDMIRRYCDVHKHVWPEIMEGQKEVGILDMQIFRRGTHVFMIMDTVDEFDFERDMVRLAGLPRQAEWEAYVAKAHGTDPSLSSHKKWRLMEKIFELEK